MKKINRTLALIFGYVCISFCTYAQSLVTEKTDEGMLVLEGTDTVLFYQEKTKSLDGTYPRANYIHPLYGLEGEILTEDFPEDHPHHRGIFWAWHQLIVGDKAIGDGWACENFSWDVSMKEPLNKPDGTLELRVHSYWKSPQWIDYVGEQKPFLSENTKVTIHPKNDHYRILDFEISLLALEPNLKIGGSDDEKGYSGFSVRMKLPDDISFSSSTGQVTPTTNAIEAGPWMNMAGSITGSNRSGIVVMSHRDNPTYPEPWILRNKNSMQNVVFPGRHPMAISNTRPTVLKYRLVVYAGTLTDKDIELIGRAY